jgi:hypothetical protein
MTDLRKLARDKPCNLRLPGYCTREKDTTVLCHIKRGWCGSSKPPDVVAVWGCHACHAVIDGRIKTDWSRAEVDSMILRALCEQLVWYSDNGVITWGSA